MADPLPECPAHLPNLCGSEAQIDAAMEAGGGAALLHSDIDFSQIRSASAVALHMHQPLIPAGGGDLKHAAIISNLRHMLEHPEVPDAHNASAFLWCYKRLGEIIPQLVEEGKSPRIMLDYSGCLLHGLRQMGAGDVIDAIIPLARPGLFSLRRVARHRMGPCRGASTPPRDFRRHVRAWQHHFASLFGLEALGRVRGFSPPEMALPNHPDTCHEFLKTLLACGYKWVLVQEHSVEAADDGGRLRTPHLPHRLVSRNSYGETLSIVAIIKTQGSDTKLVGQMQPYYEAKGLSRVPLGRLSFPQLVTQIGDGENGGVMMNEFPPKYLEAMREASGSQTPAMNVSEYLEHLAAAGANENDFPQVRPLFHRRIWEKFEDGSGPQKLETVIADLRRKGDGFHVEGGSWTGERSWEAGYENVMQPMEAASAAFAKASDDPTTDVSDPHYQRALFHLLLCQTSCFRYWGQGAWTDYGRELCRRATNALDNCGAG